MTEDGGGWYPDPEGVPGRERWWDGSGWTDRTRDPADVVGGWGDRPRARRPARFGAPARRRAAIAGMVGVAVLAVVGAVVAARSGQPGPPAAGSGPTVTGVPEPGEPSTGGPEQPAPTQATCPPAPRGTPTGPPTGSIPPATGKPVTDSRAGISYAGQGEPWQPWRDVWVTPGMQARFAAGYFMITQHDTPAGDYYATVLSGTVPARLGDAPHEETRCVAEQVAEDVRAAYYPVPNTRQNLDDRPTTVSGRAGYLVRYHLTFDVPGYAAKGEQVGVLVADVGRPELAVIYISVPDTVRGFDYIFDQVFASVRAV